jgi:hypothetical protein
MSKGDPEFERFDSIVRKAFSVPHNEIVRREKQYQQKRKRAKQKRVKTSPAMMAAALWQNDNLSFWQLFLARVLVAMVVVLTDPYMLKAGLNRAVSVRAIERTLFRFHK